MADISHIQINGEVLDIKDEVARSQSGGGVLGCCTTEETLVVSNGECTLGLFFVGDDFGAVAWSQAGDSIIQSKIYEMGDFEQDGNTYTLHPWGGMFYYIIGAENIELR